MGGHLFGPARASVRAHARPPRDQRDDDRKHSRVDSESGLVLADAAALLLCAGQGQASTWRSGKSTLPLLGTVVPPPLPFALWFHRLRVPRQCLCLVFQPPSWLRQCVCMHSHRLSCARLAHFALCVCVCPPPVSSALWGPSVSLHQNVLISLVRRFDQMRIRTVPKRYDATAVSPTLLSSSL